MKANRCASRHVPTLTLLAGLIAAPDSRASFELVREWNSADGMDITHPAPSARFADGSQYIVDRSASTPYPVWRLQGDQLTPLSGLTRDQLPPGSITILRVQTWAVIVVFDGVKRSHFRIDGLTAMPLADLWGPMPTTDVLNMAILDVGVVFSGVYPDSGRELWLLDEAGFHFLGDVNPGPAGSHAIPASQLYVGGNGDHYVFGLDDGETGPEPWVLHDGTLNRLADLQPGAEGSYPRRVGTRGQEVYFGTTHDRIYKTTGQSASLVVQDAYDAESATGSFGYFTWQGDLYAWWGHYSFAPGHITRIGPDDTVVRLPSAPPLYLQPFAIRSVAPWQGVIELQGYELGSDANGNTRITSEGTFVSPLFSGWAYGPTVKKFSEIELLFQDDAGLDQTRNVYCISAGTVRPMWEGRTEPDYGRVLVFDRGDWIYIRMTNNAAETAGANAKSQLWAMKWPEGCQEAWDGNRIFGSGFE